jgi:hypothetical protein
MGPEAKPRSWNRLRAVSPFAHAERGARPRQFRAVYLACVCSVQGNHCIRNLTQSFCLPRIESVGSQVGRFTAPACTGRQKVASGYNQSRRGRAEGRFMAGHPRTSYGTRPGINLEDQHENDLRLRATWPHSIRKDPIQRPLSETRNPNLDSRSESPAQRSPSQQLGTTMIRTWIRPQIHPPLWSCSQLPDA